MQNFNSIQEFQKYCENNTNFADAMFELVKQLKPEYNKDLKNQDINVWWECYNQELDIILKDENALAMFRTIHPENEELLDSLKQQQQQYQKAVALYKKKFMNKISAAAQKQYQINRFVDKFDVDEDYAKQHRIELLEKETLSIIDHFTNVDRQYVNQHRIDLLGIIDTHDSKCNYGWFSDIGPYEVLDQKESTNDWYDEANEFMQRYNVPVITSQGIKYEYDDSFEEDEDDDVESLDESDDISGDVETTEAIQYVAQNVINIKGIQFQWIPVPEGKENFIANIQIDKSNFNVSKPRNVWYLCYKPRKHRGIYDKRIKNMILVPYNNEKPIKIAYETKGNGIHICTFYNDNRFNLHNQLGNGIEEFKNMLFNGAKGIYRPSLGLNITSKHDIKIDANQRCYMKNYDITRWNQRIDVKDPKQLKLGSNTQVKIQIFGEYVYIKTAWQNNHPVQTYAKRQGQIYKDFKTVFDEIKQNKQQQRIEDLFREFKQNIRQLKNDYIQDAINEIINDEQIVQELFRQSKNQASLIDGKCYSIKTKQLKKLLINNGNILKLQYKQVTYDSIKITEIENMLSITNDEILDKVKADKKLILNISNDNGWKKDGYLYINGMGKIYIKDNKLTGINDNEESSD